MKTKLLQFRSQIPEPEDDISCTDSALCRFADDEEGSTVVLTLFVFIFMLVMAGLGIDLMRFEMERTHLQATLDSAVLAGAGAPAGSDAADIKAIVEDYFAKAEMSDYLHAMDIDGEGADDISTSLNATSVYAEASLEIDTYLMKISGVDTMSTTGAAAAEVRTPKLEVSLILDVSGSMSGTKLTNLKTAASEFVTTILDSSDPGDSVISIVPFSFGVTPPATMYDALTVNETHNYSTCLRFDSSDFSSAAIDPSVAYNQRIFTSVYGTFDNLDDWYRSCYTDDRHEILPYSTSETDLHAAINALSADGQTSGHLGIKWGAALLDPAFQSVATALQGTGEVDATLENVPSVYGESETLKIIVMMGDGSNTTTYQFTDSSSYRGPNSDLYLLEYQEMEFQYAFKERKKGVKISYSESKCSDPKWECVYEATGDVVSAYYLRDGSDYFDIEEYEWIDDGDYADIKASAGFIGETRLDWEQAWGLMSPDYFGDITGDWGPWNDYVGSGTVGGSTKDSRMSASCTATKTAGVIVYTIGYSISAGGNAETQLKACASSANHYYPTNGSGISSAFNSIASNVQNLRLTQ